VPHLLLVDNICNFELLLLRLKLVLLVNELLSQNTFLIVEIQEDRKVLGQLIALLSFDDPLDLALLGDFLSKLLYLRVILVLFRLDHLQLLSSKDLSLPIRSEPSLLLDKSLVMLVQLASFPQGHFIGIYRLAIIHKVCRIAH
jgi:hypothetical protein